MSAKRIFQLTTVQTLPAKRFDIADTRIAYRPSVNTFVMTHPELTCSLEYVEHLMLSCPTPIRLLLVRTTDDRLDFADRKN